MHNQSNDHHVDDDALYKYLPMDDWIIREGQKGQLGEGTKAEQYEIGKVKFWEALNQKATKKRKISDHWCIGHFGGGETRVGTSSKHEDSTQRTKAINDDVDLGDAKQMVEATRRRAVAWAGEAITELEDQVVTTDCNITDDEVKIKKRFSLPDAGEDVTDQVRAAVMAESARAAKVRDQEEADDHEAYEATRLKRSSVQLGRPKLSKTELATQIAKMKRDRQQQIDDAVSDMARKLSDMKVEVDAAVRVWPEDLKTAYDTMEEEHEERLGKITTAKEALASTTVDSLLEQFGDQDQSAVAVKQKLIDDARHVFKELAPAFNKSLGQFRQLFKKATTTSKKQKKAEAKNEDIPKSNIVQSLSQVVETGAASLHVKDLHDIAMFDGVSPAYFVMPASYVTEMRKITGVTPHAKFLVKECEKNSVTTFMSGLKPQITKQVTNCFIKFAKPLMPNVPLKPSHDVIRASVFTPQCVVYLRSHMHVGLAPYGTNEVRVLMDGQYTIAGVKYSLIPGATFKEKVAYIMTVPGSNDFATKAIQKDSGFIKLHDEPHTCLHIPNGYLLVTFGSHDADDDTNASAIRWSYLATDKKAPLQAVCNEIKLYEATYDMSKTVYPVYKECLEQFLIPSAIAD